MTAITKGLASCILDLARDSSSQGRGTLLKAITNLYEKTEYRQSDAERELMVDILGRLVGDIEKEVRRDLAQRLAVNDHAPHELLIMLANDEIAVAKPILLKSGALADPDLIEIVRQRTAEHRLAIATRAEVSAMVSDAIVESGDEDVIDTLLRNSSAQLSRAASEYLVASSQKIDRFQKPLLARADLPSDLAHRMFWWVSAALRRHVMENFAVEIPIGEGDIDQSTSGVVEEKPHFGRRPSHAESLVARLVELGEFNELFLVQSLRHQHVSVFIAGIAHMAGVDLSMARRIIFDKGGEALTLACKAMGMDRANFAAIFLRIRKAVNDGAAAQPVVLERMLAHYDKLSRCRAKAIVALWQQDAHLVTAIIPPGLTARAS